MKTDLLQVQVARKTVEALDICSLELVAGDGHPLPAFAAGSHVDLHLPNGLVRQYSLCNDPSERHCYRIAVLRDAASRGGSNAVHESVREGDRLHISPPRNLFPLAASARRSLLLAGGIGITPILAMARQLWAERADFEMHYCTRSHERTAFHREIMEASFAARVSFHHDDGQAADLPALLADPAPDRHLYFCGPKGFMDAVLSIADQKGWAPENVHYEFFAASPGSQEGGDAFDIRLARSGRVVRVPPSLSVTQALAEAGVAIETSCEQGVCGTCLTTVLEGEPDHRDIFLSPKEQARNDCFMPCCSRSHTAVLVLDL